MIINCSRMKVSLLCKRKYFNNYYRGLEGMRSMNLVDGGAFHDAVASGLATPSDKNWAAALAAARPKFDEGVAASAIPPEQEFLIQSHWDLVVKMVQLYKENYENEDYQIIQPECQFDVALPHSHHNCLHIHHIEFVDGAFIERWGPPSAEAILEKRVRSPHEHFAGMECKCWVPHRLVGKTDAVVRWKQNLWLLEHKTSSIQGPQFWDQWEIDVQPTTYLYGIWKSLGIAPSGFVVDMIFKPSEKQVESWNKRRVYGAPQKVTDYMSYEREAFLRTKEDLLRIEQQYIDHCNDEESRLLSGYWPMSNTGVVCKLYNRRCDYWSACVQHEEEGSFAGLVARNEDYVTIKRQEVITT